MRFDADLLRRIAPRFTHSPGRDARQQQIIGAIGPVLGVTLARYDIGTALRAAHFLAQTCEESYGFSTIEEEDGGAKYEGRRDLGNVDPGDGPRFKGRGLIQLTGRANYARYSKPPELDLIADPEQAAEPATSLRLACEYWTDRGLNALADWDDALTITYRINGGFNGLDARRRLLATVKAALGVPACVVPWPGLRRGDAGAAVMCLQAHLRRLGYPLGVDGELGPRCEDALIAFQRAHGLTADGVAGPLAWQALQDATD
jgi:putative chitinase